MAWASNYLLTPEPCPNRAGLFFSKEKKMNDSLLIELTTRADTLTANIQALSGQMWTLSGFLIVAVFGPIVIKATFGGR